MLKTVQARWRYIWKSGLKRRLRDIALRADQDDLFVAREDLARRYLTGDGVEIGALSFPLRAPPQTRVRYVDYMPRADLIRVNADTFTEARVDPASVPDVDVVDDAQTLSKFTDNSLGFVVANHVLEHMEDPIATLESFLRVLRPGGILFLTVPDARYTFDAARRRTTVEHLLRDHDEGPIVSRRDHYEEWARFNEELPEDRVPARADEFAVLDARHHFHVWELEGFLAFLYDVDLPCRLEHASVNQHEFAVVVRKH